MSVTVLADHRAPGGRFAKGRSGNPAGRPKGVRNRATVLAEQLEEAGPELIADAVGRARGGDAVTLRTLIGLMLPRAGDRAIEIELPPGTESDDEALFAATLRAVVDGVISPAEGLRVGRLIALRAKVAERVRRLERLAAREAAPAAKPPATVPAAPVSGLYSAPRSAREPAKKAESRETKGEASKRALPTPSARAAHGPERPVPGLYFSQIPATRRPLFDLSASAAPCAIAAAAPLATAAARDAIQRLRETSHAAI